MDRNLVRKQLEAGVAAAMEQASRNIMQWGKDDCALWSADIVRPVLGYDPAVRFRGRYTTRNGARRVLGPKGLEGAMRAAARRHKWKRIDPSMAGPGDAGLAWTVVEIPGKPAARVLATVICRAPGWFVGRNEKGFTALRASDVLLAWSVLGGVDNVQGSRVALAARGGVLRRPEPAYEPISAAIGLSALLSGTILAGWGGTIVAVGLSVAVSLASSLLQPQVGAGLGIDDTANAKGAQYTERQPLPVKRAIVGRAYVGGALFFEEVKPPYLTMGVLINHGEIDAVERVFVGTNELSFPYIAQNQILTPVDVAGQPAYPTRLLASFRYGSASQTRDLLIAQDYTSVDSTFRQQGIATGVYRFHYGTDSDDHVALWGQVFRPNMYVVARGARCYDPREPTQSVDDESTWRWTNNATLVQTWYLTRTWGGRVPTSKIRWDKIKDSASYDDELMACADGTLIKRHTIDGVVTLNQRPYEVMQNMLTANRARVVESGGEIWVSSSRPKTPIATIHDRILASGIKYQAAKAKRDLVNKLQVRFVSPDQDNQLVDGPILNRTDLQASDQDNEVLPGTIALNYTQDHRRAQRLQKAALDTSRLSGTLTCSVDLRFMAMPGVAANELIDQVITFDSELFGIANGDYLVAAVGFSDDMTTLDLALSRYDGTIETAWNPSVDEQPFTLADVNVS